MRIQVARTALHLPPDVETAAELSARIGRSERWIVERTGVVERRVTRRSMHLMAADVLREAVGDGPPPDLLINASLTPIQLLPDSSVFIQQELGWSSIPSFSVHATCMGFVIAMHNAAALVHAGAYRRVAIVSAEHGTRSRDMDHPESAALIGDGAAAAIIQPTPEGEGSELLGWRQTTWPAGADLAQIPGCGTRKPPYAEGSSVADNLFRMNGPRIYRMAIGHARDLANDLVAQAGLTWDDVDLCVPHQGSGRALAAATKYLPLPKDKVVNVIAEHGNCISASIPMALAHAVNEGRLKRGQTVLLLGTGAGLHVAGMLLRW